MGLNVNTFDKTILSNLLMLRYTDDNENYFKNLTHISILSVE